MKYLLFALLLVVASCKQNDPDVQPAAPRGFRQPTCGDIAGEGVWEHYNDSERVYLLNGYAQNPETLDPDAVHDIDITKREIKPRVADYSHFTYIPTRRLSARLIVQYDNGASIGYEQINEDSNVVVSMHLEGLGWFRTPGENIADANSGCYRLYYIFGEPYNDNGTEKYRVVNKGHFDVNIEL